MPIVIRRSRQPDGFEQFGRGIQDTINQYQQGNVALAKEQDVITREMLNMALQDRRMKDANARDERRWGETKEMQERGFAQQDKWRQQDYGLRQQELGLRQAAQARELEGMGIPSQPSFKDLALKAFADASLVPEDQRNDSHRQAIALGKLYGAEESKRPIFSDTNALGKRFTEESKPFLGMSDSLTRLMTGAKSDNAAGDMAAVFSYMKLLDPTSVVRESEYATAENARGVPDSIRNLYNKVLTGERLTSQQRMDFVKLGRSLWDEQKKSHFVRSDYFTNLARESGMDPSLVVQDFISPIEGHISSYDQWESGLGGSGKPNAGNAPTGSRPASGGNVIRYDANGKRIQ